MIEMTTTRNFRVMYTPRGSGLSSRLIPAMSCVVSLAVYLVGCAGITETQLPDGVIGPATYNNREGATRLTQAARSKLASVVAGYVVSAGLLTDELSAASTTEGSRDRRNGHWIWQTTQYGSPHSVRALARLARGVVGKYVDGNTSAWQAQLFLYEAYAEILLAEGWCSGVPLSTLDFEGDWTYRPGSTTDEIYAHAIVLLDSADVRVADSVSLQSAIRLLKARAQLALGRYAEAKQTVQGIDGAFQYTMRIAFDAAGRRGNIGGRAPGVAAGWRRNAAFPGRAADAYAGRAVRRRGRRCRS